MEDLIMVVVAGVALFVAGVAVGAHAVLAAIREEAAKDPRIVEGDNVIRWQPRGVWK